MTFDADQTLVDFRTAMRHSLELGLSRLRQLAPAAGALTVDDLVRLRDEQAVRLGSRATMEEIRLAGFEQALRVAGGDIRHARPMTDEYLGNRFRLARLYDDALPVLHTLREQYVLGLASNGNSYPERSGLAGFFDFTVFAQDHGVRKPDLEFYRLVVRSAVAKALEMVHVGDSLVEDVDASQSLGIRAVWLNRDAETAPSAITPWAKIRSLHELPEVLRSAG